MKFHFLVAVALVLFRQVSYGQGLKQHSTLDVLSGTMLVAKADLEDAELKTEHMKVNPYTVQVASYVAEQDALHHVGQLRKFEKQSFYYPTFTRGQVWFKVCAGRFATATEAEGFRKTLVKKTDEPFAVVISLQVAPVERKTASQEPMKEVAPLKVEMIKKEKIPASETGDKEVNAEGDYLYTLQIGSFPTRGEAETKGEKLKSEGSVNVVESQVQGKIWYRVFLGSFETKKEAEAFLAQYSDRTSDKAAFVKRLTK